tara:strand:- start:20969 stop:21760 length:792 start_codon:yes stop_codon:yes gene_type:complete
MAGLTGNTIASSYKSVLRVNDNANGVDTAIERVTDGEGTESSILLSDDSLSVRPVNDNTTSSFTVSNAGGSSLLAVDSTNSLVKVNANQDIANTQYTSFQMNSAWWSGASANNHYPLSYSANQNSATFPTFGTGTDPQSTFTTAASSNQTGGDLVPMLWYVMDDITIDSVVAIEGADAATGDTTRMHLMSYTYSSGATSTLTGGTVLAYNSDVTNAGAEQTYKSTFTIGSSDVDAGKVILAFLRSDSINSDYSVNMYIKYHLR